MSVKTIDYAKPETIVEALRGQDALIITLSGFAPQESQEKLIWAAAEAQVPWILPNEWSPDTDNDDLWRDISVFRSKPAARESIKQLGKSKYIAVSTGFWYEWSLAIGPAFGIDMPNKNVTFFDDGETKISVSTWPQVGRAVAAILSLPIEAGATKPNACLEALQNRVVYINSFTVSQREMFQSVLRVTGSNESEWKISSKTAHERYKQGLQQIEGGERIGFVKMLYTRIFYQDGSGNTEKKKGTINDLLNLPKEDIDEATKAAEIRSRKPAFG